MSKYMQKNHYGVSPVPEVRYCEHCNAVTTFERQSITEAPEGEVCGVCGDWVCVNCVDWSKSGINEDIICLRCTEGKP